ncbi:MAG: helix-turn-helix transcriptional regulator [Mogibacterium sp.]|nr:helix-turn-helix transcriptional regulator [Mogibacterium sp.]
MGRPSLSAETIRNNKVSIISAAMKMIRENGIQSVSARSLGSQVGMNSALIYRYFKDIDEVVLFACVHALQEYNADMTNSFSQFEKTIGPDVSDDEYDEKLYYLSWELFCSHAFRNPEEYNILFFSKHSDKLPEIIKEYYELFPCVTNSENDIIIEGMYRTSNLRNRNLILLIPVLSGRMSEQDIILINDLTVSFFYALLVQLLGHDQSVTAEAQKERMLKACNFLLK